ncbi:MAG TPA: HAMP domain-containing protein, partial [Flavisolibacter sp.]|nr:HAMP domain-containing protein [Flavisolibacter sp.]
MGTFFLFLLLLLTGGFGIYYIASLKKEGKNVLKDNYESLLYCHTMQKELNKLTDNHPQALNDFEAALSKQEQNITEPGEEQATAEVRKGFSQLKAGDTGQTNLQAMEDAIQSILALNMQAIQRKSSAAEKTAGDALTIIIVLGSLVFLIAFSFLINFPSVVTNPINRLAEAIKEIANKNYSHRVHLDNKDEFGALASAFNEMAERLQYFENSNVNKLLFEKSRAEAVINSLKDASIGIDKNNVILFTNYQALQLLGLRSEEMVGKPVEELQK